MEDQVSEIKSKVDIVSLIGEFVQLKKAGRHYKGLCPFHSEKTPSFIVSPELQIFKCFGCNESGDCFSFLEKYEGMDFPESLRFLAERVGVELKPFKGQRSDKDKYYEINNLAARFYSYLLLKHNLGKEALLYLTEKRKLELDTIKEFQIGFAPNLPNALQRFLVEKKKVFPKDLENVGLATVDGRGVVERFRGRIMFPLFDHRGNVVGFSGRILPKDEKKDLAKYINTPETEVYHKGSLLYPLNITKGEIKKKEAAIVVEGQVDAISIWQAGFKNVVAIIGSSLTNDQVKLLSRFAKEVILSLDSDIAGNSAAVRGLTVAQNSGLTVKVARIVGYKDPDDCVRENPEAFRGFLEKAQGVWDFLIDNVFSKYDAKDGAGKGKISREVTPILSSIADKIVQAHYIQLTAKRLGVSEEAVFSQVSTFGKEEAVSKEVSQKETERSRREVLEERMMAISFQSDPENLVKKEYRDLIKTPILVRIVSELAEYLKKEKKYDPSVFARNLPMELTERFSEIVLSSGEYEGNESFQEKELTDLKRELGVLAGKEEISSLTLQLSQAENSGEKKLAKDLEKRISEITAKLSSLEESD